MKAAAPRVKAAAKVRVRFILVLLYLANGTNIEHGAGGTGRLAEMLTFETAFVRL
jgi:hypothetical protein